MWVYQNFVTFGDETTGLMEQVTDFLNENKIKKFKIIESNDNYIEIIYFKEL